MGRDAFEGCPSPELLLMVQTYYTSLTGVDSLSHNLQEFYTSEVISQISVPIKAR